MYDNYVKIIRKNIIAISELAFLSFRVFVLPFSFLIYRFSSLWHNFCRNFATNCKLIIFCFFLFNYSLSADFAHHVFLLIKFLLLIPQHSPQLLNFLRLKKREFLQILNLFAITLKKKLVFFRLLQFLLKLLICNDATILGMLMHIVILIQISTSVVISCQTLIGLCEYHCFFQNRGG